MFGIFWEITRFGIIYMAKKKSSLMNSSSETSVIITHKTEVTDACSSTCWDFKCNKCIDQNVENGHLNSTELLIP